MQAPQSAGREELTFSTKLWRVKMTYLCQMLLVSGCFHVIVTGTKYPIIVIHS